MDWAWANVPCNKRRKRRRRRRRRRSALQLH
jgi:hypothetical protein